ncbi:MAG: OmpH family outer membrane protein [Bacteroidetes bacterium]|uniref:OmpH family outer membrane protein n=1 Tax=Candidatus Cryptobacteroides merdigallinarum TaxID=2840770 RepID=A0A9D9EHC0_9BACT|nr:OmpH family outer membrane protein [Candidatus Cryptobacteroides merdigallinarum]
MKNVPLILSIVAVAVAVAGGIYSLTLNPKSEKNTPADGSDSTSVTMATSGIVYVDLDRIVQEYDMASDLGAVVETRVKNIQDEVNRRGKQLESEMLDFQNKINKGLITRSVAEVQGQELQKKEAEFNEYANQKNNEVIEEQTVMMNQIADAIQTFMEKYNEEKKYTMILTNQRGVPVITADRSLDITDDVILRLNEEYIKEKNKNNK